MAWTPNRFCMKACFWCVASYVSGCPARSSEAEGDSFEKAGKTLEAKTRVKDSPNQRLRDHLQQERDLAKKLARQGKTVPAKRAARLGSETCSHS